jgi:hypothetical protein
MEIFELKQKKLELVMTQRRMLDKADEKKRNLTNA